MKYLVGETSNGTAVFAVSGDSAVNLTALDPGIGSDLSVLAAQSDRITSLMHLMADAPSVPTASIVPALPIADPSAIICVGLNYTDHIKEGGYDIPDYPALFMRSPASIMAAGKPLVRPTCSEQLDYEAELMLIVGKGGRHISEADALDHVFGYTVFNDGSVRDYQRKTHQWTPGKNFDSTGAIGPFVVTPDEVPEGAAGLKIESRVGKEILQSSNTANMIWGVRKIIAVVSEYTTLAPGDLIALGTPPGVGHAKKPNPRWLVPGETVEIEIEGIGICASPIVDEADHAPVVVSPMGAPVGSDPDARKAKAQEDVRALRHRISRLSEDGIGLILRDARSHYAWTEKPVPDSLLKEIYDIAINGATSRNTLPARFVFVKTPEGKERLAKTLMPQNVAKMMAAPVTAIIAYDTDFWTELPFLFPHEDRRHLFEGNQELCAATAFRNGTLQGAYFMIAARALGLDVGGMSGFSNKAVDEAFFAGTTVKSNFLCNLGYADETALFQKLPRFDFDKVCTFA